jgi:hypothetical protein
MYRWTRRTPLDTGHKYGDIIRDGELGAKSIRRFLASGSLVPVSSPPLSEVPGRWDPYLDDLSGAGIEDLKTLLDTGPKELASSIGKSIRTVKRWQADAEKALKPPPDESG